MGRKLGREGPYPSPLAPASCSKETSPRHMAVDPAFVGLGTQPPHSQTSSIFGPSSLLRWGSGSLLGSYAWASTPTGTRVTLTGQHGMSGLGFPGSRQMWFWRCWPCNPVWALFISAWLCLCSRENTPSESSRRSRGNVRRWVRAV